jgi:ATP-dependent RNA helicase DDX46/PRP5
MLRVCSEVEEEVGMLEEEGEAKADAGSVTEGPAAAAAAPSATMAAASSAQLAALEKAKDLAKKMSGVEAARRQAELIAAQLSGKPTAAAAAPSLMDHCSDELEINDYPLQARKKVQARDTLERVVEMTGVAIISRGEYIDPTKKPEPGKRKLCVPQNCLLLLCLSWPLSTFC